MRGDEQKVFENAIAKYGEEVQTDVLIEEMAELTQAILKYRRYLKNDQYVAGTQNTIFASLCGEIADVGICLDQLSLILKARHGEDGIKLPMFFRQKKIERLQKRLMGR